MKFSKIFIGKNNGQSFKHASLLLCSAVLSSGVYAADGQITFAGSVYAPTCSVKSKTLNVTLEKISNSALSAKGTAFGSMPFVISLEKCDLSTGKKTVGLTFEGTTDTDATNVLVNETSGGATGIGIAIYSGGGDNNGDQMIINGAHDKNQIITMDATSRPISNAILNLPLVAKYYNYGGNSSPSGDVSASVAFSVTYQ
ncbi:hypothetical protein MACH09_41980 [Vibrio sp. MACH09]|uniref:fimbrial protein n=1 Tax=Vibrio sp. MACH09 TaxID=3025122 RepID=UPI002791A0EB|nr:fimbrial protein [Vibrio sp. MACH09]GLO63690.1 hypothetical protein MACH09_41980 [Vibrio sp. MACH09]